jgi:hypothetical protein
MNDTAFLPRIPPLEKFDLHTRFKKCQPRVFNLCLKAPMSQGKRIRMIE